MKLPKEDPQRIATVLLYLLVGAAVGFIFFKYLFGAFLPFGLAFLFSAALRPAYRLVRCRTKLSARICATVFVTVCAFFTVSLLYIFFGKLYNEALALTQRLSASEGIFGNGLQKSELLGKIYQNPIFKTLTKAAQSAGVDLLSGASSFVAENVPKMIAKIAEFLPSFLFSCIVFLFSAVYFLSDYGQIKNFFKSRMTSGAFNKFGFIKRESVKAAGGIIKGYFAIFCLTFAQLLLGFWILGTEYAFMLALIVAFIDILPLVGTGVVLLPWGVMRLLDGDTRAGIILLCLFVFITIVREIAEPAVLGKQAGLHPLASMLCIYIGFATFGIKGMILAPAVAGIVKNVLPFQTKKE